MMFVVLCPKTVTHRSDSSTEMNVTKTAVKTTKNRRLVAYAEKKPCLLFFRLGFFLLSSRFSHKCKITTFLCCHHIFLLFKRKKNKRQQRAYRSHRNHTHCTQLFYIYRILLLHQTIKFRLAFFFSSVCCVFNYWPSCIDSLILN